MGVGNMHEDVLLSLRQIIRAVDLHSRKLVHDHGLTGPQLLLLRTLERLGQVPVGELARDASLSHATVTGVLDRLEKRGLVQRTRSDEDKRKVLVSMTEPGRLLLVKAPSLLQEEFIARFQKLEAWEQTLVLSSVQRIAAMMQAEDIEIDSMLDDVPFSKVTKESVDALLSPAPSPRRPPP